MIETSAISDPFFKLDEVEAANNSAGMNQFIARTRINSLCSCLAYIKGLIINRLNDEDVYSNVTYMAPMAMNYCLDLCEHVINLLGIADWESNGVKGLLSLEAVFLE